MPWYCVPVCSGRRPLDDHPLAERHSLPFPSISFCEGPPSRCFGPWSAVSVSPWWRVASSKTLRTHTAIPFTSTRSGSCSWWSASMACVGELRAQHDYHHFPPCVTCSRLNRSVNGGARAERRNHPQHHRHMLCCPPHAIPPAMQCYRVVAGARTLAVPDILLWELHISHGVMSMLSARLAHSTPQRPRGGAIHFTRGMRGFRQEAMVLCSRLQLAAPTG